MGGTAGEEGGIEECNSKSIFSAAKEYNFHMKKAGKKICGNLLNFEIYTTV